MKIGVFASKYGLNASAVRFYIDKALLTPKRENGQYVFDKNCSEQMEKILKYKKYKFTLEEIELLFYYENLSNLKDRRVICEIINILREKKDLIENEILFMKEIILDIDDEIEYYIKCKTSIPSDTEAYLPLSGFDLLCCPRCGNNMRMENAVLEPCGIKSALVECSCGYSAHIEDGVLLCPEHIEESPLRLFENVDSVLATTSDFSASYRGLMEKGHLLIYQHIFRTCKSCHYVLVGPLTYNFILGYMGSMTESATVVIVDPSINKINKLKEYLADSGNDILFIAGDIRSLPIKKDSIDLYIDDFSFNNYMVTYNLNIFEIIAPFLSSQGKVIGQFVDYSKAPRSLKNIKTDHPEFNPEYLTLKRIYSSITDSGLKIIEKTNLGSPEGKKKDFVRQVGDEKVSLVTYIAGK
ncbi:MAG: MerR family transcriptional regulator [Lentihominibacter sp.]|jgi:DNA-binding transcriptional MerR regulator